MRRIRARTDINRNAVPTWPDYAPLPPWPGLMARHRSEWWPGMAGIRSGQVDIAIEFGFVPSFPMPGTEERLLLAESVACVVEVKSNLIGQWDQVRETTRRVRELRRHLNPIMMMGGAPSEYIPSIAVGYTGHNAVEALQNRLDETPEAERPDAALVIQSGSFVAFGMTATGAFGLYGLCLGINILFSQVGFVAPDLAAYAR